jgi:hypothetical protein
MMLLRLQMLAQLAMRCSWKRRSDDFQKLRRAAGALGAACRLLERQRLHARPASAARQPD